MNTTTRTKIVLLMLASLLLVSLFGCAPKTTATPLEGQQREEALAKAEPVVDNLFQAMQNKDYAAFTKDFASEMKTAMTEARFNDMLNTLDSKIGAYQSREVAKVEQAGKYIAVTYTAAFAEEPEVAWRVVFDPETYQVSGLWYNSPKLRVQ